MRNMNHNTMVKQGVNAAADSKGNYTERKGHTKIN